MPRAAVEGGKQDAGQERTGAACKEPENTRELPDGALRRYQGYPEQVGPTEIEHGKSNDRMTPY